MTCRLVFRHNPDIGRDPGIVKAVVGELNDRIQPVVFNQITADLARPGTRVSGKKRRAVLNNRHPPSVCQLGNPVEQKEHLPVTLRGESRSETPAGSELMFLFHRLGLPLPIDAERRVGDDVIELVLRELIVVQGVAELHVVRIAAANQHVGFGDAVGEGVQLLPERGDDRIRIQLMQPFFHAGEHLTGSHGHVVNRFVDSLAGSGSSIPGHQKIAHRVDDIPAGEVCPRLLVVTFRKPLHQILEHIPHVHCRDFIRVHIGFFGAEVDNHLIEQSRLRHPFDLILELHLFKNIQHIFREPVDIRAEVVLDVVGIRS